jgi:hydrogenase nickel incorporation protein HypB
MCDTCGCALTGSGKSAEDKYHAHFSEDSANVINIRENILHANDHQAGHIRDHLRGQKIKSFNLMSSPGSGKTTLLERTIERLGGTHIAVIEGDLETENDAMRIRKKGARARQITTGTACHLDAFMVHEALHSMDLTDIRFLFVENVGNLVCPASFDVGTDKNIVLLSAAEGDDKPEKYPVIFYKADLILITKKEAAQLMNFDLAKAQESIRKINKTAPVYHLSLDGNDQFDQWLAYIQNA